MIDPNEAPEVQIEKQAKIIDALIDRANRQHEIGGSAYSLFQSAIALQAKISQKTKDLEQALDTLGRASNQLENSEFAREQTQRNMADALDAMEGGFALFSNDKLQVFNDNFKKLVPDVARIVAPGLPFGEYIDAINRSIHVKISQDADLIGSLREQSVAGPATPFVLGLRNDRWFQVTYKHTRSGNIVVLQTEITGIVRRNKLEQNRLIDEQEHFLKAAFDHMSQGVCTFSAEGTLLINNRRFGEMLGLPYHLTRVGTAFDQIVDFYQKNDLLVPVFPHNRIQGMMLHLARVGSLNQRVRHANGSILDMLVHPLPDGGFIVNVIDVTVESQTTEMLEKRVQERTSELTDANERLRAQSRQQTVVEEELRLAKEKAEAAVSSKTRFLAAASHDLLQPINAAKLLISNLIEYSRETNMEETVKRLDGSFNSIESLLHALLDISRLDSTETELTATSFCIDELLQSVSEDYAPLAEEKGLRISFVPSSIWVVSDKRYLLRSIQNLVVNAIQYTERGRVLVGCRRRGGKAHLEFWDTGIGISKKDQVRIFNEFTRVEPEKSGSGMGLGLSIVDRACRHLGHKVRVRSGPGVGSVFTIELPMVAPSKAPGKRRTDPSVSSHSDMDLIIMLIENDPDVLYATTQRLESWGASVLGAESTAEALTMVEDLGMAPDIILADYQLNEEDTGIEAILALRAQTRADIPAIMITANRGDDLLTAGREHRFSVLTKPVQLSRLRPLIDWKTRHVQNPNPVHTDQGLR